MTEPRTRAYRGSRPIAALRNLRARDTPSVRECFRTMKSTTCERLSLEFRTALRCAAGAACMA